MCNSNNTITNNPSIFNDVIGPVMRGPSSSHCAAALRIGRMARDLMDGKIKNVQIEFDHHGSLATTHKSQGSDMGLFAGLLGWDITDERLADSTRKIQQAGINVCIKISNFHAPHPNTYKIQLSNSEERHSLTALSTGGGAIKISEIDGAAVSINGDYYETLIYFNDDKKEVTKFLCNNFDLEEVLLHRSTNLDLLQIKSHSFLPIEILRTIEEEFNIISVKNISPVLPVLSYSTSKIPFVSCNEMLTFNKTRNLDLWQLALIYESSRGNISQEIVFQKMKEIIKIMRGSIQQGIKGTQYNDRILGNQSGFFHNGIMRNHIIESGVLNQIILYTTAMMEVKSSLGVIVAAPTAGACGVIPGTCFGAAHKLGISDDDIKRAILAAGMIGIFIAARSTFAAEVGGCQAECGAASGMAAAGLVTLFGGTLKQAINAGSIALQNTLGMICDPVANRVEVPCLGKNVLAASNALACANMALANFDPVIPLDEVIKTMDVVGRSLPSELRCTGLGGLSITPTSKRIETSLDHAINQAIIE